MKNLKIAGWSGILMIVLGFLLFIFNLILPETSFIYFGIAIIFILILFSLLLFWIYGFIKLASYSQHGKLLKVLSWIRFVLMVLLVLFMTLIIVLSIVGLISSSVLMGPNGENIELSQGLASLVALFLGFILLVILIIVLIIVFQILFGVGLIKIGKDVEYAKVAGILTIVGASTLIIFIGSIILWVAFVFEIVMFFKASKKFE
jgi:uncharacterized membrane protein